MLNATLSDGSHTKVKKKPLAINERVSLVSSGGWSLFPVASWKVLVAFTDNTVVNNLVCLTSYTETLCNIYKGDLCNYFIACEKERRKKMDLINILQYICNLFGFIYFFVVSLSWFGCCGPICLFIFMFICMCLSQCLFQSLYPLFACLFLSDYFFCFYVWLNLFVCLPVCLCIYVPICCLFVCLSLCYRYVTISNKCMWPDSGGLPWTALDSPYLILFLFLWLIPSIAFMYCVQLWVCIVCLTLST